MTVNNIAIIGLGLIGGSIAASVKSKFSSSNIVAFDVARDSLQYAKDAGIIDKIADSIPEAISNAELIIIAAPISTYSDILRKIQSVLQPDQVITDVASVKNTIINIAAKELGDYICQFVPGHPLAGSDKSGIKAAMKNLFIGRKVLLTPLDITKIEALLTVTEFWEKLDASVNTMLPDRHDKILTFTSHLPHLLAYVFMGIVQKSFNVQDILENTGNGFKDFTRIAASDQKLWTEICLANSGYILGAIDSFEETLTEFKIAIKNGDQNKLIQEFGQASSMKQALNMAGEL